METSEPSSETATTGQPSQSQPTNDGNRDSSKKNNVRKRTKTGCLTCRKRRIKCDEAKPTCNNCIKSKRMCEGYNQRVVFKNPMGFPGGPFQGPPIVFSGPQDHFFMPGVQHKLPTGSQGPLPTIAPKPQPLDFQGLPAGHYGMPYQSPGLSPTAQFSQSPMRYEPPNSAMSVPGSAAGFPGQEFWSPDGQYGFNSPLPRHSSEASFAVPGPSASGGHHSDEHANPMQVKADELPPHLKPNQGQGLVTGTPAVATPRQPMIQTHAQNIDIEYEESDDYESMDEDGEEYGYDSNYTNIDRRELGMIVARKLEMDGNDAFGIRPRTFGYSAENILAFYTASPETSPLSDRQTASIFRHFVTVTGPSMSLYERHPFDPSPIFQGQPIPKSRRHIWTYTFPILSFSHPALLHSMLALGSLQMAKYNNIPPTSSLKHYHLALRKVKKNIRGVNRRTHAGTLAATLLLGYFEVWSSDHEKWCKHLLGSRLILKEIPFPAMSRAYLMARRAKKRRIEEIISGQREHPFTEQEQNPEQVLYHIQEPDHGFVRELCGRRLAYESNNGEQYSGILHYTDADMESYEQLSDLFWWYCKMDTYQSILSGTKPLMDYELWTQVPPRAPMGRIDSIYGTYDHLMLLLGRVASFSAKDLARKRKYMATQGPPGMRPGGGPPGGPGRNQPSPPTFPGMFPRKPVAVTTTLGFSPPREPSPQSEDADDIDLDSATAQAMAEWQAIREAFSKFQAQLTDDFQPLDPEYHTHTGLGGGPRMSPFGPARSYRTFSIAGLWMNLYMGLIVLYRAHPKMPPVAMVAAGMMARDTWEYAAEIGRVAAGLSEDVSSTPSIATIVAAAFIESCFCLFVAGIQYQDIAQRHWLVRRMHDIARLTGWQSARQIAEGCESAWTKAADLGRGPPYQSPEGLFPDEPSSVWVNPRRIDRAIREAKGPDGQAEQRLVLHKSEQAHYALGLLGVEQDLERLDLKETS
ncbi:uncharacterized protein MKZ38_003256 [Zalerion maritima]|uniref:Zn(2)-C6 fungal-type domain-containing protein n=1 Tax=Zalerion maritima TaxID=339359 RepID=A0AAD5S0L2_9PEZI|nr:uncharacterized protein MKZ38_003256 [Zalerion maritima]